MTRPCSVSLKDRLEQWLPQVGRCGQFLIVNGRSEQDLDHLAECSRPFDWYSEVPGFLLAPSVNGQLLEQIPVLTIGDLVEMIGAYDKRLERDPPARL